MDELCNYNEVVDSLVIVLDIRSLQQMEMGAGESFVDYSRYA